MKVNKNISAIIMLVFFLTGCNSIKETLSGVKKNNSDEFLIKKKNPLILPPDFDNLPEPEKKNSKKKIKKEKIDFSKVLTESSNQKQIISQKKGSLEKSISSILNSK